VIALPPSDPGAEKLTVASPFPAEADVAVGAPGAVAPAEGVTRIDGEDGSLVPTWFVAVTVKV
jgi:hypothetical protein